MFKLKKTALFSAKGKTLERREKVGRKNRKKRTFFKLQVFSKTSKH